MEYKRSTNKNLDEYNPEIDFCSDCKYYGEPNGCNRPNGTCANYDRFLETYNCLNELEDKIENGMFIELPFNVGDTVYKIIPIWQPTKEDASLYKYIDDIIEGTIRGFRFNIDKDKKVKIFIQVNFNYTNEATKNWDRYANSSYTTLREEDYNKKWFSNRYDAQVKLKELKCKE